MAGTQGFIEQHAGEGLGARLAGAWEDAKTKLKSLRGSPVTTAAPVAEAAAAPFEGYTQRGPMSGITTTGASGTSISEPRPMTTSPGAAEPTPVSATPKPAPTSGVMGKAMGYGGQALRFGGKVATPVTAMVGSYDAIKEGTSNMDDQIALETMQAEKRAHDAMTPGFMKGFMDSSEAVVNKLSPISPAQRENLTRSFRGSVVNTSRRVGNAAVPDFIAEKAGDKLIGGARDLIQGNPLGTTKFDSSSNTPTMMPVPKNLRGSIPQAGTNTALDQEDADQGAAMTASREKADKGGNGMLSRLAGMGAFGSIAALQGYGAMSRMKKEEADLGLRNQTAALNQARFGNELKQQAQAAETAGAKRFEDLIKQHAEETVPPLNALEGQLSGSQKNRDVAVTQQAAKTRGDIEFTLGKQGGKKFGDLAPAEQQRMFLLAKVKDKVENARGTVPQYLRDFWGVKRSNSRDLNSYDVSEAVDTVVPFQGGYTIKLKNGNTMSAKRSVEGGWSPVSPNDPIDADMLQLIAPALEKAEASKKGGIRNATPTIAIRG